MQSPKRELMAAPKPELQNTRVIYLATRFVRLPLTLIRAAYAGVIAMIQRMKTDAVRRAEDQTRQSRARRMLRGLPPDHVQR